MQVYRMIKLLPGGHIVVTSCVLYSPVFDVILYRTEQTVLLFFDG